MSHDWTYSREDGLQPLLDWPGTDRALCGGALWGPEETARVMEDLGMEYAGGVGSEHIGAVWLWRRARQTPPSTIPYQFAAIMTVAKDWPMCIWVADEGDLVAFWQRYGPFAALTVLVDDIHMREERERFRAYALRCAKARGTEARH